MEQMRKRDNRYLMGEPMHLWEVHKPEDVDTNPAYFDKVIDDLVDRNMGNPKAAISFFKVFLGDPLKQFHWAEFMVQGVKKTPNAAGVPEYRLLWERMGDWQLVDVEELKNPKVVPIAPPVEEDVALPDSETVQKTAEATLVAGQKLTDPPPISRGPGRPRKN